MAASGRERQSGGQQFDTIPTYLSSNNDGFRKLVNEISTMMTTAATATTSLAESLHTEDDVRQIAMITHKIISTQLFQSLWMAYQKSGTGQLNMNQTGPLIWPLTVKSSLKKPIAADANEDDLCMALVMTRLYAFAERIQNYQTELDKYTICLRGDREAIHQTIQRFLQHTLENLRRKIEHKITLVQYDYNDRVLALEFLQLKPSPEWVRVHKKCSIILFLYFSS